MSGKPSLLFVSPQFLFPLDAGGKIRSASILKHMKGGAFSTRLLMPATAAERGAWREEIAALADEIELFQSSARDFAWKARRALGFFTNIPVSAFSDADAAFKNAIERALRRAADIVVFDYAQTLAAAPKSIGAPHVFFAHNVETEILDRHASAAKGAMRFVWAREAAKMRAFERRACVSADGVIAVSDRDAENFRRNFGAKGACSIPTGVDAEYFRFTSPAETSAQGFVFMGSLDWKANIDGLCWFMDDVWPRIIARKPDAAFIVIGKNPPRDLVDRARLRALNWRFTGFVDDVRPHARGAAFVIPLRIGGGTRIKAFEAMAMGLPVVSTALGVEGLPVRAGEHLLVGDSAEDFAAASLRILDDHVLRARLAASARSLVERDHSHEAVARAFERCCLGVLSAAPKSGAVG